MKKSFNPESCLKSLATDFSDFRSNCKRNQRFPDHLRQAVISAIHSGLKPSAVSSVLGVTSTQLKNWQHKAKINIVASNRPKITPRILQVLPPSKGLDKTNTIKLSLNFGRLILDFSF